MPYPPIPYNGLPFPDFDEPYRPAFPDTALPPPPRARRQQPAPDYASLPDVRPQAMAGPTGPAAPSRSWGEAASDFLVGVGTGATGLAGGLANLTDLATFGGVSALAKRAGGALDRALGGPGEGYTLQEGTSRIDQAMREMESDPLRQRRQQLQERIDAAGQQGGLSGGLEKAWEAAKGTATDLPMLGQLAAEQVPILATMGLGTVGSASRAGQAARAAGATPAAIEQAAQRAAIRSNIGFSGAMGAGFSSQQAAQDILAAPQAEIEQSPDYRAMRQAGMDDRAARAELARLAGYPAAAIAGPASALAAGITAPLETAVFRGQFQGGIKPVVGAALRETAEEIPQESSEQIGTNVGVRFAGVPRDVWANVPEAAGMAGVAGFLMGGALGGVGNIQTRARRAGMADDATQATADLRANLDFAREQDIAEALAGFDRIEAGGKVPKKAMERLNVARQQLTDEMALRASPESLNEPLENARGRAGYLGFADRAHELEDDQVFDLAQRPLPNDAPGEFHEARAAYGIEAKRRQDLNEAAAHFEQNPEAVAGVAKVIAAIGAGKPLSKGAHGSTDYNLSSLSDSQLTRYRMAGEVLLRDHADELDKSSPALEQSLDLLHQEADRRANGQRRDPNAVREADIAQRVAKGSKSAIKMLDGLSPDAMERMAAGLESRADLEPGLADTARQIRERAQKERAKQAEPAPEPAPAPGIDYTAERARLSELAQQADLQNRERAILEREARRRADLDAEIAARRQPQPALPPPPSLAVPAGDPAVSSARIPQPLGQLGRSRLGFGQDGAMVPAETRATEESAPALPAPPSVQAPDWTAPRRPAIPPATPLPIKQNAQQAQAKADSPVALPSRSEGARGARPKGTGAETGGKAGAVASAAAKGQPRAPLSREQLHAALKYAPIKNSLEYAKDVIRSFKHLAMGKISIKETMTSGDLADLIAEQYDLSDNRIHIDYSALKAHPDIVVSSPLADQPAQRKPRVLKRTETPKPAATQPNQDPRDEKVQAEAETQVAPANKQKKSAASQQETADKKPDIAPRKAVKAKADTPNPAQDSLLVAIAKLGGLDRDEARRQGVDPAEFKRMPIFGKPAFRKAGGKSFDAMAESLSEYGYPVADERGDYSPNALLDAIGRELSGNPVYTPAGHETAARRDAEMDQIERDSWLLDAVDFERSEFDSLNEQERVTAQLQAEASRDLGEDIADTIFDRVSKSHEDATPERFNEALKAAFDAARQRESETGRQQAGEPGSRPAQDAESPLLQGYSLDDLRAEEARLARIESERKAAEAKAEAKAKADKAMDGKAPAPPKVSRAEKSAPSPTPAQEKAANRLRAQADALDARASDALGTDRKINTAKRANQAAAAVGRALSDQAMAKTMRSIADAIESGGTTYLQNITTRAHVEELQSQARLAMSRFNKKTGAKYDENQTPSAEHADFAKIPELKIDDSYDAKRILEELKGKRGIDAATRNKIDRGHRLTTEEADLIVSLSKSADWRLGADLGGKKRLAKIGVLSDEDLRAALLEFLDRKQSKAKEDPIKRMERELVGKNPGIDFFPTPPALADRVVREAGIKEGMSVLEPSAGKGDLLDAVRRAQPDAKIEAVELSGTLRELLDAKGYDLVGSDFEKHDGRYDRIVMNPPFSDSTDIRHVRRAYDMLNKGGRLVAIMGEGAFFRSDKQSAGFREWLDSVGGSSEKLPDGSFKSSFRPTGVAARLVVIDKRELAESRQSRPSSSTTKPATVAQARAQLVAALGERDVAALERSGRLVLHAIDPSKTGAAGFVDGDGVVHLIPGNMDQTALDVALHEAMHLARDDRFAEGDRAKIRLAHAVLKLGGLKNFVGNPGFSDLVQQVYRMAAEGNEVAVEALNKAKLEAKADPRVDVAEESVAYLVEYADEKLPLVRRVLALIRAALYRMGIKVKLTPADVRALALSALKARAKTANRMATEREAMAFSLPDFAPTVADRAEVERQMAAVKEARDAQGRLLAPNGKPSKLNARQWKQVRTKFFKDWFGDWENDHKNASKVVDENGEPLVVYHGTSADIGAFDRNKIGSATDRGAFGKGFYFAAKHGNGMKYAGTAGAYSASSDGGNIVPAFLNIRSPLLTQASEYGKVSDFQGHDGVMVEDATRGNRGPTEEIVAFSPNQIKSAIGNAGTFSSRSDRIDYSQPTSETDAAEQARLWAEFQAVRARFQAKEAMKTPFLRWFGAGTEGVTARDGKPLVLYHGTNSPEFNRWDASRAGQSSTHPTAGLGFFMTADKRSAARYGSRLLELHAKIDRPYYLTDADLWAIDSVEAATRMRRKLMAQGYDGAVVTAPGAAPYVVVFESKQAKHITNEEPTESEDFRYSKSSSIATDAEYMAAVERGDMKAAQRMVDEAARAKGYTSGTEYRMQHQAPDRENQNLSTVKESGLVPDDYWTRPDWYQSSSEEMESFYRVSNALRSREENIKKGGSGNVSMVVYRAVNKSVKGTKIRNGDWVTPSEAYARQSGSEEVGGYRILKQKVFLKNLWWDGNSIAELGYDNSGNYAYSNTKNNAKKLDAVTRDNNGIIIPLSKRFNKREADTRYSRPGRQPRMDSPRVAAKALGDIGDLRDALKSGEKAKAKIDPRNWAQMLSDLKADKRPQWLGLLTQDMLLQLAEKHLPAAEVRKFDAASEKMDAHENKTIQAEAFPLAERWQNLMAKDRQQADAMSRLIYMSTWFGVDPRQPAPKGKQVEWTRAKATFDGLTSAEARKLYGEVLAFYEGQTRRLFDELAARIERHALPEPDKLAAKDMLRQEFERMRQEGPYAPLMRFGDLTVWAEPRDRNDKPVFATFESVAEQRAFADWLKGEGYSPKIGVKMEEIAKRDLPQGDFVGKLAGIIDKTAKGPEAQILKDAMYQLFLRSLPEQSIRKHFIHRKFVPGYSADALRTFATFARRSAKQTARLAHADKMGDALDKMAAAVRSGAVDDPVAAGHLVNELDKSYQWAMAPTTATWASRLTHLGFLWHLGASPAHLLLNLSQQAQVTAPWLAGELAGKKGFGAVASAMLKANRDFLASNPFVDPAKRGASAKAARERLENEYGGDMGRALKALEEAGKTDKTQTYVTAQLSEEDNLLWVRPWTRKITQGAAWFFHVAEVINRESSAIAAYRLGRASGMDHEAAYDLARRAINDTHFDYAPSNRARFMRGNVAKVLTLFKQYSLNITWQLGRNAYLAARGASPHEKTVARTKLLGMLGMTFVMAGAVGLPFYGEVMWLLTQLLNAARDDDEPEWDADTTFRALLDRALSPTGEQVVRRGLVNAFLGVDLSSRVKFDDLWWRDADSDLQGKQAAYHALEQALGPVAGLAVRGFATANDAIDALLSGTSARGATWRALEGAMPKAIKDISKAFRFQTEGATTFEGARVLEPGELGNAGSVGQLLGFSPASLTERYAENRAKMNLQRRIQRQRDALLDSYAMAHRQSDEEVMAALREDMAAFNKRYPGMKITDDTIDRSLKARARRRAEIERYGGVALDKRLAGMLMEGAR